MPNQTDNVSYSLDVTQPISALFDPRRLLTLSLLIVSITLSLSPNKEEEQCPDGNEEKDKKEQGHGKVTDKDSKESGPDGETDAEKKAENQCSGHHVALCFVSLV